MLRPRRRVGAADARRRVRSVGPPWSARGSSGLSPMDPRLVVSVEAYGNRIERLLHRLELLRRRLQDPACPPSLRDGLQGRVAWLHGAIFAISAELDTGY